MESEKLKSIIEMVSEIGNGRFNRLDGLDLFPSSQW